jgi:hypothetical protein
MLHQVWTPKGDKRGLGGDQIQMALSSWQSLYGYWGDEDVKANMKFMADYYLKNSLSSPEANWARLPFPYNTNTKAGIYDGDMVNGKGVLQPDKAGSFALELVHLYKMFSGEPFAQDYLQAAMEITGSLLDHLKTGDADNSPLPFRVFAQGNVAPLVRDKNYDLTEIGKASYTSNWFSTMQLLLELGDLDPKNKTRYQNAFDVFLNWMKKYPLENNKWGPFFEDVSGWSDTQINATTGARFMMDHRDYFPKWKDQVPQIFKWTYDTLGDLKWEKWGLVLPDEQTSYRVPGESHTARQGATELLYSELTGDSSRKINALRQLNWATYMVDDDGKNVFPSNEIWMTDGYGDYIRHYLAAMNTSPELAPRNSNHILFSTSIFQKVKYQKTSIFYQCFDRLGHERIRMADKPISVWAGNQKLSEDLNSDNHFAWTSLPQGGGLLEVSRHDKNAINVILK